MREGGTDGRTHKIGNSTITNASCDLDHYKSQMCCVFLRLSIVAGLNFYHNIIRYIFFSGIYLLYICHLCYWKRLAI